MFDKLSEAEWAFILALRFYPTYVPLWGERALVCRMIGRKILKQDPVYENQLRITELGNKLYELHRVVCS